MQSDLRLKNNAIPYLAQIFGYNRNEQSDNNISLATNRGDLAFLANTGFGFVPLKDNYIRILKPSAGQIISAFASIALTMAASEPFSSFRLSITKTTSETDLTVVSLTDAQIAASHARIKGSSTPYSNSAGQAIVVDRADISSLLPKYGSTDYRSDCFVLGIHFIQQPVSSGFSLVKLNVDGSALVVQ